MRLWELQEPGILRREGTVSLMGRRRENEVMKRTKSLCHWHRFPADLINCAASRACYGKLSMSTVLSSMCLCKSGAIRRSKALLPAAAAFKPSAAQDCDRPVAQLSGGEGCRS